MESNLPDWIHEGAEVYVEKARDRGWVTPDPKPVTVVRFTPQRVVVENEDGEQWQFRKDDLRGGPGGSWDLIPADSNRVISMLRTRAVSDAMSELRSVFREMELYARIGKDELPLALEAAEKFHDASLKAIDGLVEARQRYGDGS
jgi:hypothetical protein